MNSLYLPSRQRHLKWVLDRVRQLNDKELGAGARYVLYWAQMNRRVDGNHALAFACSLANDLGLPVLYYEGLTCSYPYASDRFHTFILEGVPDTARRLRELGIGYVFYLRKRATDANDVVYRLAAEAAALVTDDYPTFVNRDHNRRVPEKLDRRMYAVDSSCVVPMSRLDKREWAAYTIRPRIHRALGDCLQPPPPIEVQRRYRGAVSPYHTAVTGAAIPGLVAACEIDHTVKPSVEFRGGRTAALARLDTFLDHRLRHYATGRNEPTAHVTSDLSPYLHFGHISGLEVALATRDHARRHRIKPDEFLEELIVRRELAFNFARHVDAYDSLDALPEWAQRTLAAHRKDEREYTYRRAEWENASTHDDLWNATQHELLARGKIHGYYRMYWGKKIIEWSKTPEEALATMIYLHDRHALDGRDPNTYTNILWCFGLHDRPWQERPVIGMVRCMTRAGMDRKTNVRAYVREIEELGTGAESPQGRLF